MPYHWDTGWWITVINFPNTKRQSIKINTILIVLGDPKISKITKYLQNFEILKFFEILKIKNLELIEIPNSSLNYFSLII